MVTLYEAIKAAQTDLRLMARKGISLIQPLEILSLTLWHALENEATATLLAKDACEAIIDCAHKAEDADKIDLAERLRGVNRMLSSVVAGYYTQLK